MALPRSYFLSLSLSLALVNNLSLGILHAASSFTFLLNLISAEKRVLRVGNVDKLGCFDSAYYLA